MSADNGIYILGTKGKRGKREYRVAHAQAIENIEFEPDCPQHKPELNTDRVRKFFGKAAVLTDYRIAWGYARRMHEEVGQTEYGIVFLDRRHVRFPKESHPALGPFCP